MSFDKSPYTNRKKNQKTTWQYKNATKTLITNRLRTDVGRPVEVTKSTQLVLLNRFTGTQPSHSLQQPCNQKDPHLKIPKESSL